MQSGIYIYIFGFIYLTLNLFQDHFTRIIVLCPPISNIDIYIHKQGNSSGKHPEGNFPDTVSNTVYVVRHVFK